MSLFSLWSDFYEAVPFMPLLYGQKFFLSVCTVICVGMCVSVCVCVSSYLYLLSICIFFL